MTTSAPRSSRSRTGATGFFLFFAIAIVPITASLVYALLYTLGMTGLLSEGLTFVYWGRTLLRSETWLSFALSAYVATAVSFLATAGGLAIALVLRRQLERGPLSYLIYLPLALPATVAAFAGFQILAPTGLLSRVAVRGGLIDSLQSFPPLTNDKMHIGVILVHAALAVPFFALLFAQLMRSERIEEYGELSRSLGASARQTLARVTVPILLTRARTNILLLFVVLLGSYEIPLLLGRQHPLMLSLLTVNKYQKFDITQKPEAFAIAILYTLSSAMIIVYALRTRAGESA